MWYNFYGDIMKKLFTFILLFMFMGSVSAKEVTLDNVVNTINNGVITEEYKNSKLSEVNGNVKVWDSVSVKAKKVADGIEITYEFSGDTTVTGTINAVVLEDGKTLQSKFNFNEEDKDNNKYRIEIHDMLVYWVIETSDGFEKIQKYVSEDYINKFNGYFNKCYREELHACRTYVESYGNYEYISDVEMNEESTNYVIGLLKKEARSEKNNEILFYLLIAGVVIAVLFFIARSMQPKVKPIKY